ncbi:rhodanese-like domain-containing protein [uncultured Desulfosarcina sp.]|uniref:rhodanese-like domain-containing protein n=1 Tax=uncultured Desulfosarcina sp. TaxID=218289 RepID=UPI0029C8AC6D|nr:rhodanese-like domain-containing protein [uncultured Desulfosarcina sp.]
MRWKQFFTPAKSISAEEARTFMVERSQDEFSLIDVRQPKEYDASHIPGSKLIPIADLDKRLEEIDPSKPALVYCAVGGRSRVAAQMLSGKGFDNVINIKGGIKAWGGHLAVGSEELGLELLTGNESIEETLVAAYSLESGLRDFYLSMNEKVRQDDIKKLFQKLAQIETLHQDRIFDEYLQVSGSQVSREDFENGVVVNAVEGGLTTDEYIQMFKPDWESAVDIISLAMSIEAQALDLYTRASERSNDPRSTEALKKIADEERAHLEQLGKLLDERI